MTPIQLVGILVAAGVGFGVWRANPTRAINRGFLMMSAGVCLWLAALTQINPRSVDIVLWLRLANAACALLPWLLWILKETIKGEPLNARTFLRSWPWFLVTVALVTLCFTDYFYPQGSTRENAQVGWGRNVYLAVISVGFLALLAQAFRQMRQYEGIRRVELQFLVLGGTMAGLLGTLLSFFGERLELPELRRPLPWLSVIFYCVTAWAVTSRKIFDARQLFRSTLRKLVSVSVVVVLLAAAVLYGERVAERPVVVVITALMVVMAIDRLQQSKIGVFGGDENSESARRTLLAASRQRLEWTTLEHKFTEVLAGWGRTEHAYILVGGDAVPTENKLPSLIPGAEAELIRQGWVTPERLHRELPPGTKSEIGDYLREHRLGVMVAGPGGEGSPTIVIALCIRSDQRPFTWVDIQFLKESAVIVESSLSRVLLTQQAKEAEQLATAGLLGASLAHEIRNPLVTIKSLIFAAPSRFREPEFQRLFVNVLPAEITRIEDLVSGLMDLGKPRHPRLELVRLNEIVDSSLRLVLPKAKEKDVAVAQRLTAFEDSVYADPASLRQVILNLMMNAIDAVSSLPENREVVVSTEATADGVVLEVEDNGPGLPKEVKRTLFRPFTQSSKTSGMGLGLAICADIIRAHHGTIVHVDGETSGAVFRITLPPGVAAAA